MGDWREKEQDWGVLLSPLRILFLAKMHPKVRGHCGSGSTIALVARLSCLHSFQLQRNSLGSQDRVLGDRGSAGRARGVSWARLTKQLTRWPPARLQRAGPRGSNVRLGMSQAPGQGNVGADRLATLPTPPPIHKNPQALPGSGSPPASNCKLIKALASYLHLNRFLALSSLPTSRTVDPRIPAPLGLEGSVYPTL